MRTRTLSLLLAVSLLLPNIASAYFPEDVMLPSSPLPPPVLQTAEPSPSVLPPPLSAIRTVAYGWNADDTISRGSFVAAIVRRLYKPSERCFPALSESDYSLLARDVAKDAPYGIDLCTAMRAGLMRGDTRNLFRPDAPVTRAEAAKALSKAFLLATDPTDPAQPWSENYVDALIRTGALSPETDLDAPITRGELSTMLWTVRAAKKAQRPRP